MFRKHRCPPQTRVLINGCFIDAGEDNFVIAQHSDGSVDVVIRACVIRPIESHQDNRKDNMLTPKSAPS